MLSNLLDKYGINIVQAASGNISTPVTIPGLTAPKPQDAPKPISATLLLFLNNSKATKCKRARLMFGLSCCVDIEEPQMVNLPELH